MTAQNTTIPLTTSISLTTLALLLLLFVAAPRASHAEGTIPCTAEPTDMLIAYGDLVSCAIDVIGDSDSFHFTATANDAATIQVTRTAGTGTPCLQLYDPNLVFVTQTCNPGTHVQRIDVTLALPGSYTILVSEREADGTFNYNLALERRDPVLGTSTCYSCFLSEALTSLGEIDVYSFDGTANDAATIQVTRTTGTGTPCLQLYDPDGVFVTQTCNPGTHVQRIDVTLAKTGPYTILVVEREADGTFNYNLALERRDPVLGTPICYTCFLSEALTSLGEINVYSFDGTANDAATIQVTRTAGTGTPCLQLYDPDGVFVAQTCNPATHVQRIDVTLAKTGPYTILVVEREADGTFNYNLALERRDPVLGTSICFECLLSEALTSLGEIDVYYFDGIEEDAATIQVTRTAGTGTPCLQLYDPDGVFVAQTCNPGTHVQRIDITLAKTGPYTILVVEREADGTFNYNLALERRDPVLGATICYGCFLSDAITSLGEIDVYYFDGIEDDAATIQVTRTAGTGTPCLQLYDPDGVFVTQTCNPGTHVQRIDITLAKTGPYTILVVEREADGTFNYNLALERRDPVLGTSICFGCLLSDAIASLGEIDVYYFDADNGQSIRIDITRTAGTGTPCLQLYDPDGVFVAQTCNPGTLVQRIERTLTLPGRYTVLVVEREGDGTYSYDLNLTCLSAGGCPLPPLTLSINDIAVTEGNAGTVDATFTVSLSGTSSQNVTVKFTTANGTAKANSDYVAKSGTLTFTPGQTSKPVVVSVKGDTLDELNETFFVNLSSPVNATIAKKKGVSTIIDDDPPPTISISDVTVTEKDTASVTAVFTVSLSTASGQIVKVKYATANGTAAAGSDYVAKSGTLTFNPGQTVKTITVTVKPDVVAEPNETFFVNLSNPTNAVIGDGQGVATIVDND